MRLVHTTYDSFPTTYNPVMTTTLLRVAESIFGRTSCSTWSEYISYPTVEKLIPQLETLADHLRHDKQPFLTYASWYRPDGKVYKYPEDAYNDALVYLSTLISTLDGLKDRYGDYRVELD